MNACKDLVFLDSLKLVYFILRGKKNQTEISKRKKITNT